MNQFCTLHVFLLLFGRFGRLPGDFVCKQPIGGRREIERRRQSSGASPFTEPTARQGRKTKSVLGPAGACRTPLSDLHCDAWDLHPTGPSRYCARRTCNIACRKRCMASAEIETGALVLLVIRCLSLNVGAKKYFVSLYEHDASTARQLRP